MHTDHDPVDPSVLAELGYEHRDVHPKPMAWAAFWLFLFTIGSGILAAFFIRFWNIIPEVPVEQRAFHKVQPPVGTPILQNNSDNTADIAALRRNEAEILNSPAALPDGTYRIPVDAAIKMIAERGLPKTATQPVTRPAVPPGVATGTPANSAPTAVPANDTKVMIDKAQIKSKPPVTQNAPTAQSTAPAKPAGAKKQ